MKTRREFLSIGGALAAATLLPTEMWAQASPTSVAAPGNAVDPMSLVNPELRPAIQNMLKMMPQGGMTYSDAFIKQARSMKMPEVPIADSPAVTQQMIPGPPGGPQVLVYVAGNVSGASKPAVLHIHGGGYILGSASASRKEIQDLSTNHDCVAVTVEYRLAPETHFPGSLEDNYAALRWMNSNAKELGIDVSRIAIKGESAGGGHAAALAIAARDRGEFPICLQVLIYPMLDDRTGSTHQLPPYFGHFGWTPDANRYGWTSLLGVPAGSATVPPNSVPARVANLSGLPPVFIGVGSIDLFALEDVEYAHRLMESGIPVELNVVPGAFHGFDGVVPDASISRQFTKAWNEAVRRAFEKS